MEWTTLLYVANEIPDEKGLCDRLKQGETPIACIEAEPLSEGNVAAWKAHMRHALGSVLPENALMIVTTHNQWEAAQELQLAALPYVGIGRQEQSASGQTFPDAWMIVEGFEEVDFDFLHKVYQRFHGIPWKILETQRCYLREISMEDMDDLFALYAQEGVTDYIEPLYERKEEEEYQRAYIDHMYRYYGYGMWLVYEKETDRLIGRAGLEHREYHGEVELEMGYLIAPKKQRQGYATEVCRALISYAHKFLDFPRINCLIQPDNFASIRLVEALEFTKLEMMDIEGKNMLRYIMPLDDLSLSDLETEI